MNLRSLFLLLLLPVLASAATLDGKLTLANGGNDSLSVSTVTIGATNVVNSLAGKADNSASGITSALGYTPANKDEAPFNLSSTTVDLSLTNRWFSKTTSGALSLTLANTASGKMCWVIITNGGSDTLSWQPYASIQWSDGTTNQPALSTGTGVISIYQFKVAGSQILGAKVWPDAQVTESGISLSDVTTLNASTTAHGFMPKLDGDTNHVANGNGAYVLYRPTYTVSQLPTASTATGAQVFCSDTLTPDGTGGLVVSDGTNWRLVRWGIKPDTDSWQYMLNTHESLWHGHGKLEFGHTAPGGSTYFADWVLGQNGTGATTSFGADSVTSYDVSTITMGSASGAYAYTLHPSVWVGVSNITSVAFIWRLQALPNGTDNYHIEFGLAGNVATPFASSPSVSGFYDLYQGAGLSNTLTNNYYLVNFSGSASNLVSTGVAASTSVIRAGITVYGTNESRMYINGSCVATNTNSFSGAVVMRPYFRGTWVAGAAKSAFLQSARVQHRNSSGWSMP